MNKERTSLAPISAETLRRVSDEISRDHPIENWIPDFSEVVLLEVDPHRVHAYWYLTPADLQLARRTHSLPNAPLVLRLYDITTGSLEERPDEPRESLGIAGLSGNTYFEDLAGGHVYVADLALLRADGSMVRLTHSNPVHLPHEGESEVYELVVVDISQEDAGGALTPEMSTAAAPLPVRAAELRRTDSSPYGEGST